MTIKPILFNTEMVKALFEGRKTVTRRIIKPQPICHGPNVAFDVHDGDFFLSTEKNCLSCRVCGHDPEYSREGSNISHRWKSPYNPGDILYVRETWGNYSYDNTESNATYFMYRADFPDNATGYWYEPEHIHFCDFPRWRPSIHMPKEAARLFLRVKCVSVERLHDIDSKGIRSEGVSSLAAHAGDMDIARQEFAELWDGTIKKSEKSQYGWDANPWVWVIEFERCGKPVEVNSNG